MDYAHAGYSAGVIEHCVDGLNRFTGLPGWLAAGIVGLATLEEHAQYRIYDHYLRQYGRRMRDHCRG